MSVSHLELIRDYLMAGFSVEEIEERVFTRTPFKRMAHSWKALLISDAQHLLHAYQESAELFTAADAALAADMYQSRYCRLDGERPVHPYDQFTDLPVAAQNRWLERATLMQQATLRLVRQRDDERLANKERWQARQEVARLASEAAEAAETEDPAV